MQAETNIEQKIKYKSVKEYEQKLESLLENTSLPDEHRIYLRLVVLDQQLRNDARLHAYFDWAIDQYRHLKENFLPNSYDLAIPKAHGWAKSLT